jgi:hypothetical protein
MVPDKYMALIGESIECLMQEYINYTSPNRVNFNPLYISVPQYLFTKMTFLYDMLIEMPDLFITPRAKQEFFEVYFQFKSRLEMEGSLKLP